MSSSVKNEYHQFQLVFTFALKNEVDISSITSEGIALFTLKALKSGILNGEKKSYKGILVIITGVGKEAGREAAEWILQNLDSVLFVVNIGSCGVVSKKNPLNEWIRPLQVANEKNEIIRLDSKLPFFFPEKTLTIQSLLTVTKPAEDVIPESWEKHDIIDMECYEQAKAFQESPVSFSCIKYGSDYSDKNSYLHFSKNVRRLAAKTDFISDFNCNKEISISVIIPVRNREATIVRAIDSVLQQSYKHYEIIVVNDCSDDQTDEIVKQYSDKIKYLTLPAHSGVSAARNLGVLESSGEWIAFLDSDDLWQANKLKKQVEYLQRYPFYEIIQSEEIWIRKGVRVNPCKHHKKPIGWIWEPSLKRCLITASSVLMKKNLFEQFGGFDESLPVCEDYDLWLRITRSYPVGLDPTLSVIKYGGHSDQLSTKYKAMDRFRVKTLMHLLECESEKEYVDKIKPILCNKLDILIKGYEKREKWKDAQECRELRIMYSQAMNSAPKE